MNAQRSTNIPFFLIAIGAAITIATSMTRAELITYDIVWEQDTVFGPPHTVSAVGSVTIDTTEAVDLFEAFYTIGGAFSEFSVTISGSPVSDGTYSSAGGGLDLFSWGELDGPIDFHSELIAQGANGFSISGVGETQVIATNIDVWRTVTGESFTVASVTPVPTPSSLALLGLGGLAAGRRRR